MNNDNDIIIEAWNTVLFDKFCRFRHLLVAGLSGHSDEALCRHPQPMGARVLDVGCGFGDSTLRIAAQVGPQGEAVGVDCAVNFVLAATREAAEAGVGNSAFFVADVQTDDLRGPYDRAFARFGTQFFNMPGAAMRNIRRALVPGGEFTMIVWRRREENRRRKHRVLKVHEVSRPA
jgi:ubiquinone/menaquinone biosynthesis C-methylase UbiE